jgi:hypothetical protein
VSDIVTAPTFLERVQNLEAEMRKLPETPIPVRHYFANGLYAREITIPQDVIAVGKIHKTQHINVISKGEVTMLTENGPLRVAAPYTWVVEPGKKAAAYAHSETVWTSFCVNPTDERDLEKLEEALIIKEFYVEQSMEGYNKPVERKARRLRNRTHCREHNRRRLPGSAMLWPISTHFGNTG